MGQINYGYSMISRSLNFVENQGVEIINMHTQTVRCDMISKLMK